MAATRRPSLRSPRGIAGTRPTLRFEHYLSVQPYSGNVLPKPPSFLPSDNSKKWHGRQLWDHLGYVRARSLSNASYRDGAYVLNHLRKERARLMKTGDRGLLDAIDRAITAMQDWTHRPDDGLWWAAVAAVDDVLVHQERRRQENPGLDL